VQKPGGGGKRRTRSDREFGKKILKILQRGETPGGARPQVESALPEKSLRKESHEAQRKKSSRKGATKSERLRDNVGTWRLLKNNDTSRSWHVLFSLIKVSSS